MADGVREKRGAGAGCTAPSTSTKVERATLCGCRCASQGERTGTTQASVPSKMADHSSRVLVLKISPKRAFMADHSSRAIWCGSDASPVRPSPMSSSA